MDRKEKRQILYDHCRRVPCPSCPLAIKDKWSNTLKSPWTDTTCLNFTTATDEELDEALRIIGYNDLKSLEENMPPEKKDDPINPSYYNNTKITPFDVINDWNLDFYLGNAIKYIKRAGKKEGNSRIQDLNKIKKYVEEEIRIELEKKHDK